MDKQKNLFIGTIALVVLTCGGWYFMYFSELNKSLEKMSANYNQLKNEKNKYTQIKNKFPAIEKEWIELKNDLSSLIQKIPTDKQFDNVTKMLFSLMEKNKLAVDNFNPSLAPLDEKQIMNPENKETILVEKYPIDVELRGNFIDFGNFLDQLAYPTSLTSPALTAHVAHATMLTPTALLTDLTRVLRSSFFEICAA